MAGTGRFGARAVFRLGVTIERVPRIACRLVRRSSCIHILSYDLLELRSNELKRKLAVTPHEAQT